MAKSYKQRALPWIAAVGLVVLAFAGFAARGTVERLVSVETSESAPVARAAQPVRVSRVTFTVRRVAQSFTAVIRPQHETVMAFRLAGKVVRRLVEVGDTVTAGQLLALMDDTDLRLSLEAAEAEVTASRTDLSRAEADSARSQRLFETGFVAKAGLEKAVSATAQAQARLDRALRGRDQAANALSYTRLTADGPGVVTAVSAEAGQVVAAGQSVVTLAPTGKLDVVFALPEQMRSALDGARATAELWGETGQSYALALRDISPDVDPVARTYRVRMSLVAPDAAVALGRTMTVKLEPPARAPAVELPMPAVINDGQGAFVWRLGHDRTTVERVAVDVVDFDGARARLRGGLAEGDLVISLGAHKVDPARPVRVVETASAASM